MAYTTIPKSSDYFNTKLYTGNGGTQSITSLDFQPDWTWIKNRDGTSWHNLYDSIRGATKDIYSNATDAEGTNVNRLTSFDSNGFSVGNDTDVNANSTQYVSWNWLGANGTAANTDGSISSTVSASTTSGFSIVSYTGTGANATVGHGLGVAPKMIIVKNLTGTTNPWWVYTSTIGAGGQLRLNTTGAEGSDGGVLWNSTAPTSSVFSVGTNGGSNGSGNPIIAYCFADVQGYSKFGSYTGNGNADGTFVYTGFKPAFVMIKNTTTAGTSWTMCDNKRAGYNASNYRLAPNLADVESTSNAWEMYSNGFKMTSTGSRVNTSGNNYIYMAFAEEPLVGDNPATAR